jgi:hypothetical protein
VRGGGISYGYRLNSEGSRDRARKEALNSATVIELVDLELGQVVTSRTFENEIYVPFDADLFSVRRQSTDGVITFDVYRVVFRP